MIIFDFNNKIFLQRINIILLSVLRCFQSGHFHFSFSNHNYVSVYEPLVYALEIILS